MNHSFHDVTFLEELYTFDAFAGESNLLESLGVHEVVAHVILIEILIRTAFDAHLVNFHTRVPGLVEDAAGLHIAQFGAHESRTLAGLNVKEFNDKEIVAVDIEAHAVFKISCCCHKMLLCVYLV